MVTACESPWSRPSENSFCYTVSQGPMNWDQARQVSYKSLLVLTYQICIIIAYANVTNKYAIGYLHFSSVRESGECLQSHDQ